MQPSDRMVHLTTVVGSFHGHVLAARLGADGIPVELRGMSDGPYPLPANVEVYVHEDQLELARALLLGDAVDAAFDERYSDLGPEDAGALDLPPMDLPDAAPFPPCPHDSRAGDGRARARGRSHRVVLLIPIAVKKDVPRRATPGRSSASASTSGRLQNAKRTRWRPAARSV